MALCSRKGCTAFARGRRHYCDEHRGETRTCALSDCENQLGIANRSGYCNDHRYIAQKEKRCVND